MRGCTVLLLFLLLCERLPDVITKTYTAVEGKDVTVKCQLHDSGRTYIFCKNDCREKDILVKTTRNSHENGRYSVRYEKKSKIMTVSIKKLQMSDSGRYRCSLDRPFMFDVYEEFWIEVTKAPTASVKPALTTSTTAVSTTQSPGPGPGPGTTQSPGPGPGTTQSPGPGPGPGTTQSPGLGPTSGTSEPLSTAHGETSTAGTEGSLLYLGLTVAVTLLLFSVALMIFYCNKRKNKPKQRPENTESAEVQECDREYDEIPEEQVQGRSTDCSSDIYSLASAPAQTQTENLVDPEHYSVVEFSRNSAPHSRTEAVVYSAVRTKETLDSTVSEPQQ